MAEHLVPDDLLTLLREVDTPTVCNAIEVVYGQRDFDVIDDGFPVLAGSIGVSHGFVHVVEIGTAVNIFGLTVAQGELIHADRHGALVIPNDVIPRLKAAIDTVVLNEAIVLEPARQKGFNIDKLEAAWAKFEARRT